MATEGHRQTLEEVFAAARPGIWSARDHAALRSKLAKVGLSTTAHLRDILTRDSGVLLNSQLKDRGEKVISKAAVEALETYLGVPSKPWRCRRGKPRRAIETPSLARGHFSSCLGDEDALFMATAHRARDRRSACAKQNSAPSEADLSDEMPEIICQYKAEAQTKAKKVAHTEIVMEVIIRNFAVALFPCMGYFGQCISEIQKPTRN